MEEKLADAVAAIQRIGCLPSILELCARETGMGFVAVSRITEAHWICCASRDAAGYGIGAGDELPLDTTLCNEARHNMRGTIIENVTEDPIYRHHPAPQLYNFQSYLAAPIVRADRSLFGVLFAADPAPTKLANSGGAMAFPLLAKLIAMELDRG